MLSLLLAGCADSTETPDLGEWTLSTNTLRLTNDLRVSETENFYFASITDFDVTSDGRIVALDAESGHLKVLRPDGTLIDTLGRRGKGPGEFQRPSTVEVARGDSVYVFDPELRRLTVFAPPPSSEVARTVTITRDWESEDWGSIATVRVLEDGLAAQFWPYYAREEGFRHPPPATWRVLHETGTLGDTLLKAKRQKITISFEGQGVGIETLPFGRATEVAAGPESRLYHGWTDSLQIRASSLDGATAVVASIPTEPIPVTAADRDSALAEIERAEIRRQFEDPFPETKPAFTDLIVGTEGRLWIERPTNGMTEEARWWRLNLESKTIRAVRVSADVTLEVVQNESVYGTTTTEAGAPALVRYQIQSTSQANSQR